MAEQDTNAFGLTNEQSRSAVLAGIAGAVIGVGASPVNAGYVTNLGIATSDPKEAELDEDLLKTREVQQGISNIRGYKKAAGALQKQFSVNTDVPLIPTIRKYFDLSKLRDDLTSSRPSSTRAPSRPLTASAAPSCTTSPSSGMRRASRRVRRRRERPRRST